MVLKCFLRLCVLLAVSVPGQAQTTIHIPADQPTIQAGINAANAGDTVLVGPGTYNENINFKGKAITVTSANGAGSTTINGGVQAATVLFQNGESRGSILSNLTITGGGNGTLNGVTNGGISVLHASPTISGDIITGAGCYGLGSVAGAPLIQGNEISHTHVNASTGACGDANGSGIWLNGADNTGVVFPTSQGQTPQVLHNTLEFNTEAGTLNGGTIGGAGINVREGAIPLIEYNIIRDNAINRGAMNGGSGGGILVFAAGATIVNNLLYGNIAVTGGGGISIQNFGLDSIGVALINNTLADNATQPLDTGGITLGGEQLYFGGYYGVFLENNVLAGNSTAPAMVCFELPSPENPSQPLPVDFIANDLFNGTGPTTGGFNGSSCSYPVNVYGNISADPLFVNSAGADYHLPVSSPGVDTGANSAIGEAAVDGFPFSTDLDGNPRVVDATHKGTAIIDIGAYEASGLPASTTTMLCPTSLSVGELSLVSIYTVLADGTKPSGIIQLTDNSLLISNVVMSGGSAGYTYLPSTPGAHVLVATFPGNSTYAGSSATCTIQVGGLATRSVLSVSPTTPGYGATVMLSAAVAPLNPPNTPIPSGSVTFLNGTTPLGMATLATGVASLSTSSLPGGFDTLSCSYSGDSTYIGSTCTPVAVTVSAAATTLQLSANPNPSPASSPVLLTAQLTSNGAAIPAGTPLQLSVSPGNTSQTLTTNASGSATTSLSLQPGIYTLTVSFAGTSNFQATSATLIESVTGVPTTTTLNVSPDPAYQGQAVTLNATVLAADSLMPSGNISFYDGTNLVGTATLSSSGQASLSTASFSVGTHTLMAFTPAGGSFFASTSAPVQLTVFPSTFAITLSPSTVSLTAGKTATVAVNLTSIGTFSGPLTLAAGPWPAYAAGAFTPGTVTLNSAGSASANLVLNTAQEATNEVPARPGDKGWPLVFAAFLVLPLSLTRSRRLPRRCLAVAVLAVLTQVLTGCGEIKIPFHLVSPGTYEIPVTATDASSNQHAATLTVVITP